MTAHRQVDGHGARLPPTTSAPARAAPTWRRVVRWAVAAGRRHAVFLLLLAAGAALRAVTSLAYRPALIYYDSASYLANSENLEPPFVRPLGYSVFLRLLPLERELAVVPAVQHLMGLLIAVLLYALLLRLGVRRWLATLATVPVLLDAYQLNLEQYILSETLFELLLVAGAALLLWRRPLGLAPAALAGVLFAAAALTRGNGLLVVVPALLAVLLLRARPTRALALVACFALPVAGYVVWYHSLHGRYSITGYGGRFLYARVAPFADCTKFSVPPAERVLCPREPVGRRPTVEEFMWSQDHSPVYRVPQRRRSATAGSFAKRVIRHQPLTYARTVATDFMRSFALTRTTKPGELPVARWQFWLHFPTYRSDTDAIIQAHGDKRGQVTPGLARFLRSYQRYAFVPGPVLAASLLLALLAALGLGRARHSGLRSASFLFASLAVAVLLLAVAVNQFTWRYQLPALVLLPPAGALGLSALISRRARPEAAERPERPSDSPVASPPEPRAAVPDRA